MKFGKTYMETMADPSFPREWRQGAIEYKHLKKLINRVVAELESLGLGADVLRELLVPHVDELKREKPVTQDSEYRPSYGSSLSGDHSSFNHQRGRDLTPAAKWLSNFGDTKIRSASLPRRNSLDLAHAIGMSSSDSLQYSRQESRDTATMTTRETTLSRNALALPKSVGTRRSSHAVGGGLVRPFDRLDMASNDSASQSDGTDDEFTPSSMDKSKWSGLGRKDLAAMRSRHSTAGDGSHEIRKSEPSPGRHDWGGIKWREMAKPEWKEENENGASASGPTLVKQFPSVEKGMVKWVEGKAGRRARAEYELGGTPQHPVPRIRLFVESPLATDDEAEDDSALQDDNEEQSTAARIVKLAPSPKRRSLYIPEDGPEGESPEEKEQRQSEIRKVRGVQTREIVIPLTADTQFLDTLTSALQNLSNIQGAQRKSFVVKTENLCSAVARASSPYASKNNLYVWREIFTLWVELQIFESQREKDRGELSIDESEARLKRFADELAKRGWMASPEEQAKKGRLIKLKLGSGLSSQGLSNQASAKAIQEFLKLNVALLYVKKFQRVNVEAARKILKKHDKRTALTASNDLRTFMAQQEAMRRNAGFGAGVIEIPASALDDSDSMALTATMAHPSLTALLPSSTTGLVSESLPHILLSLLSTTLLPILPQVDDYSCAICTSVAWRPIRLDCSHLFCIRCLVKLQKQGKDDCPLCRCPNAVKNADGKNMDEASVKFLQTWFPKEVNEKNTENERERSREELKEMGLEQKEVCVIC